MDATDILGGLLGHKSGGSGRLPDILKDILKRGQQSAPPAPRQSGGRPSTSGGPVDIEREARELEDMLNVANDRDPGRRTSRPQQPERSPQPQSKDTGWPANYPSSKPREVPSPPPRQSGRIGKDEQALVLVRAMVNAAKADGEISSAEQRNILERFGDQSSEGIQFLRSELSKTLDVREFAWSVPLGMEQQVYAMSLIAVDVDSKAERQYLDELAHGLRLPAEVCEQLQHRFAAGSV